MTGISKIFISKISERKTSKLKISTASGDVIRARSKGPGILTVPDGRKIKLTDFGDSRLMGAQIPNLSVSHSGV